MPDYFNVIGAGGFLLVLAILASVISVRMAAYLVLPCVLTAAEISGTLMQMNNLGPEVLQNHLHNLGAPSLLAFIALGGFGRRSRAYLAKGMLPMHAQAKAYMGCMLWGWLCGVAVGCAQEVLFITAQRGTALAQGYSGKLDKYDLIAYLIGGAIITFNHFKIGSTVLRKIRQDEINQRRRRR